VAHYSLEPRCLNVIDTFRTRGKLFATRSQTSRNERSAQERRTGSPTFSHNWEALTEVVAEPDTPLPLIGARESQNAVISV
jgi:hypothetical protein